MIIKVADFGLSVNIGAKEYYRLTKHVDVKLPVKWMAPESLTDYLFSEMSDVVNDRTKKFRMCVLKGALKRKSNCPPTFLNS